jgi:hypothetical protein
MILVPLDCSSPVHRVYHHQAQFFVPSLSVSEFLAISGKRSWSHVV